MSTSYICRPHVWIEQLNLCILPLALPLLTTYKGSVSPVKRPLLCQCLCQSP